VQPALNENVKLAIVTTSFCLVCCTYSMCILFCVSQTRFIFEHYHLCLCSVKSYQRLLWRQPVQSYGWYVLYL